MKRVLVIGDVIADVYRECTFKKDCPDAPGVRAVVQGPEREIRPGGAANVAVNLAALSPDTSVDLIGIADWEVLRIIKFVSRHRVGLDFCVSDVGLVKERLVVDGQFALRVDNMLQVDGHSATRVTMALREYFEMHEPDLIVMSDYGAGTIDWNCLQLLLKRRDRLLVDTKMVDLSVFDGSLLAKLNHDEWKAVVKSGESIPERLFKFLVITEGKYGVSLLMRRELEPGRSMTHRVFTASYHVKAVDVCGCGDTFIAGLAASLLGDDDPMSAVFFANAAASTVVTQPKTAVADLTKTFELLGRTEET